MSLMARSKKLAGREDLLAHAALVELAPLFELLLEDLEEVVLLDALDDLLLVVERDIRGNRAGQPHRLDLFFFRHRATF